MIIFAAAAVFLFIRFCKKSRFPVRTAAAAMTTGSLSLLASYAAGLLTGLYSLTVNLFTAAASMLLGLPFVIFYTIISFSS